MSTCPVYDSYGWSECCASAVQEICLAFDISCWLLCCGNTGYVYICLQATVASHVLHDKEPFQVATLQSFLANYGPLLE